MILYIEIPEGSAIILLELISKFSKVAGYKIKNFLYISNKYTEKAIIKATPLTIATSKNPCKDKLN
jgi:hypothetical protein